MALTEIEYGSLASSEVMNNNFEYLDDKITEVSENLTTTAAAINTNIANTNSSVSSLNTNLTASISSANSSISSLQSSVGKLSGSYITTYISGTSWYREYFSDASKKTRVWLEQGGRANIPSQNATVTISLVKSFTNTNYSVVAGLLGTNGSSADLKVGTLSTTKFTAITYSLANNNVCWYACGK